MTPKTRHTLLGTVLALITASDPLQAQSVVSPAGEPSTKPTGDLVELSPFVVKTDRDNGYQATSTLAGTRLNTPIKDLAASISIYTKDFLDDIGATNAVNLLVYATGMEAAGMSGGNFSGEGNDINADRITGDQVRVAPNGGSRTRGLASPTFTRDYFPTSIAFDSYNTSTVTVNRGPNAILFGVGSAAGLVDTALIPADLTGNKNKVQARYGNNNSWRETIDINRVLIEKKLAARVMLLNDREKFNQRPAFDNKKRIYGALKFEPFKSTSLRGSFESGNTFSNRPITWLPYNCASDQWYAAGRPSYDWTFYDDPARNPNAASQSPGEANYTGGVVGPVSATIAGPVVVYNQPYDTRPSNGFLNSGVVTTTATYAANSVANQIFNPLLNRDLAADTHLFIGSRNVWELPAAYWVGNRVAPGQQPNAIPAGIKEQTFSDFSAFDWKNHQIDETARQGDNFRTFNVAFAQTAWANRVGIELAYDEQYVGRNAKNSFFTQASNPVYIDVNVTLPTGLPNPNLGRPFAFYGQSNWSRSLEKRGDLRATGFVKYDFKELSPSLGKWLGRHTLTGVFENSRATSISYGYRLATEGVLSESIAGNILSSNKRPAIIAYMGPSIIGNNNPLRLEPITGPVLSAGPIGTPMSYFVREANTTDPGHFENSFGSFAELQNGGSASREVIKSKAVALQSYWLQDHLITMVGWRRDEDYFVRQTIQYTPNPLDRQDPGKVHYGFSDFSFPSTPPPNVAGEITSYGVVLTWPKKLLRLPQGSDLSVFYNSSSNFTPSGGRINAFGEPQGPPHGKTKEWGFNVFAFNDKLTLRVNWFNTAIQNASYTPSLFSNATTGSVISHAIAWAQEANINPQMAASRAADVELLFSTLPANFRELYQFKVAGTAPNISATGITGLAGVTDTTDYTAKGTEFDIVYNPTRKWRILVNVAKQETIQTNSLPFMKRWYALMKPVWDKLSNKPNGNYPLGYQPTDPLPAPGVGTFGQTLDVVTYVPFASVIATEGSASAEQRKWRANLVTNYTFGRDSFFGEKLSGWGVGGALRWQDKLGLGYPSSRDPDGTVHFDLAHPFYAPSETNGDVWLSYERKLGNKIRWKAQLNLQNIIGRTDLIATSVQSWSGDIARYRLAPERRWYLTNTFDF